MIRHKQPFHKTIKYSDKTIIYGNLCDDSHIYLHAFDINPSNGEISIFDQSGSKMLVFDANGEYVRSFKIDDLQDVVRSFCVLANGDDVFYNPVRKPDSSIRTGAWLVDCSGCF